MAKKTKTTTTRTTGKAAAATVTLRTKDAADKKQWTPSGFGTSADGGLANKAVRALQAVAADRWGDVEQVYEVVVDVVRLHPEDVQRAALLLAASDFSLDSLRAKATVVRHSYGPKMGDRDIKRRDFIAAQFGQDKAAEFEQMLMASKQATVARRPKNETK